MSIIEIEGRYFYDASMIETFGCPAPGAEVATMKDFQTYRDVKIIFKIGVVFYHQNDHGFFDKYTTTSLTNRVRLSQDIKKGKIFIVREPKQNTINQ